MSVPVASMLGLLDKFDPITLQQMDGVKLLDRVDTKFMFHDSHLSFLLERMMPHYYLLEIAGQRYSRYETLYFDTKQFDLYLQHHNGRLNRFKFRARRYVDSDLHFFEVKYKSNKGRTVKERIKRPLTVERLEEKSAELVRSASPVDPDSLMPRIWVDYVRFTFVSKHGQERLTIDTSLGFREAGRAVAYPGLVIAEVKQGSSAERSPFLSLMRERRIQENSISKYCLGVITLHPEVKRNRFKPTLHYIQKLLKAS
ncbi:MAG: polyphosphate polymerase domain-containing protein [Bacteroidota bacterium]